MLAAKDLNDKGVQVVVVNISCIKPLPESAILRLSSAYKVLVTLEEHQVIGGMGSAVSELISEHASAKVVRMGVRNRFGQSGKVDELYREYGLTVDDIINTCLENI